MTLDSYAPKCAKQITTRYTGGYNYVVKVCENSLYLWGWEKHTQCLDEVPSGVPKSPKWILSALGFLLFEFGGCSTVNRLNQNQPQRGWFKK